MISKLCNIKNKLFMIGKKINRLAGF